MRFPVTFEWKMIKTQWLTLGECGHPLDSDPEWDAGLAKQQIKNNYWIDQHVYVMFCSELELKKVQTAVSKHLGILPLLSTWLILWCGVVILWIW